MDIRARRAKDILYDTIVSGKRSSWRQGTTGLPQVSALAPAMFIVLINNTGLNTNPNRYLKMFTEG